MPNCTTVGTWSFHSISGLKNVVIPNLVSLVGNTFYNDLNLQSVYFEKVTSITNSAFSLCTGIEALVLLTPSVCTLSGTQTAFERSGFYIYVPSALLTTYQAATNWLNYADHFRAAEDYPDIVEQCRLGTYGDEEEE